MQYTGSEVSSQVVVEVATCVCLAHQAAVVQYTDLPWTYCHSMRKNLGA